MNDKISLKEYLEEKITTLFNFLKELIVEHDKLYDARFKAAEIAVNAALAAQEKAVAAAFLASEKAIVKAEDAQKAYNVAHNDLSRKMDEQSKGTMPRPEIVGLFKSLDDKISASQKSFQDKIDIMAKEIGDLRESRSEGTGKGIGAKDLWGYIVTAISIILAITASKFIK